MAGGREYRPRDPLEARRRGVAMIYQELSLAKDLSVMENILLGMEPARGPFLRWSEMKRRAADAMAQLGRPDIDPRISLGKLSLAQQQLVEIARAICIGCRVLVLDEPTSSLAQSDIRQLFRTGEAAEGQRIGDHLHLAFSGGSAGDFGSVHGPARRQKRRRWTDGGDRARPRSFP